jgi:outer membrane protein OmpA-like peptidoglycan-associated protein
MNRTCGVLVALLATGCAGSDLVGRTEIVRGLLKQAREAGAYQCAPRELAVGDTNVHFAEHELDQGDYFRARDHLALAEANATEALRLSPAGKCGGAKPGPRLIGDSDRDGIPDKDDKCPTDPEDKDGFEDGDGCPEPDNDHDGLVDARDKCPNDAEDIDGFQDDDGCPDPDNDQDGVPDAKDKCPSEAEDHDGFQDDDGCPELDNDKDGYPDASDKCPNEPGPVGGDGCPPKYTYINVTAERIELRQTIFFQTNKAVILPKSYALLDEVALALRGRPAMHVRIEGHTDSRGNRAANVKLSQARADSVRAYLVGKSIAQDRMEARGFGPDQPIETNKTAAGREKNRRVEFVITQQ